MKFQNDTVVETKSFYMRFITMFYRILDTFLAVAKEGSFTSASDTSYISHTAIRKQIEKLEAQLDVRLFDRSSKGVRLTKAGQVLYTEAQRLKKEEALAVKRVREAYRAAPVTLRVGTSVLYPCHFFMDIWDRIRDSYSEYQLKIIPFDDDREMLGNTGKKFDFLIGAYDSNLDKLYSFIQIGCYRFSLAVPRSNPLSIKKILSFDDLSGESLMIMTRGNSRLNDRIRDDIESRYPKIRIVDIAPHYNVQTFNSCEEHGCILLSLECWDKVHPDLKTIPLKEDYSLPFGIVYANSADEVIKKFFRAVIPAIDNPSGEKLSHCSQ